MTEQEVINFGEERIEYWWNRYGINSKPYKIVVGDTNLAQNKRRSRTYAYAVCMRGVPLIVIDYRHVKTGTEEMIKDTVLHEIAHAIDKEYNGYFSGHRKPWKQIARTIGAIPKAKQRDTDAGIAERAKKSKYTIVDVRNPTKGLGYCQRRLKKMSTRYIVGDRSTQGYLYLVDSKIFLTGDEQLILNKIHR